MSRDRKETPSFLTCDEAVTFLHERHVRVLNNGHTRRRRMYSEHAYCVTCRAEFCLTMRPEGCSKRPDESCTTCYAALTHIRAVVVHRAQQAGGHLPIENERRTDYACCRGCNTHAKISSYTGAVSSQWGLDDGGCFRRAVAAMFNEHATSATYAAIPNNATQAIVERTCQQFGLQLQYGSVDTLASQPGIVLYVVNQEHGHAVYTREPQRYRHYDVFAVITRHPSDKAEHEQR